MDTQNHSSQEQPKQNTIAKQKKSIGRYSIDTANLLLLAFSS